MSPLFLKQEMYSQTQEASLPLQMFLVGPRELSLEKPRLFLAASLSLQQHESHRHLGEVTVERH